MEYSQLGEGDMKSLSGLFQADEAETTSLQSANTNSDSFTVEMERFSDLSSKSVSPTSRITRNLSRKGSYRGEKKMNSNADNEKDATNLVPISSSPRATQIVDSSTPEKPVLVTVGATNHPYNQQVHHQITITTPATTTENKHGWRRNSFKRSSWTIDPRRMLLFFATMSSMGTILLIYLTLSMTNVGGDANTMGQ